jgi:lipid-binding SYLF domain-containing protein
MQTTLYLRFQTTVAALCAALLLSSSVVAQDRAGLDADIHAGVEQLRNTVPAAAKLAPGVKGVLIFPRVTKAGFILGALYGNGALIKRKQEGGYYIDEYYSMAAASYGLQAGGQAFGYALALMTDAAVQHVETSRGWDLGVGPSIVVVDAGKAKTLTLETAKSDIYAFTFGQKGLLAGMGLQGSKISRLGK